MSLPFPPAQLVRVPLIENSLVTPPHGGANWYAGPSTDSEEEEVLQENINTNIDKALKDLL